MPVTWVVGDTLQWNGSNWIADAAVGSGSQLGFEDLRLVEATSPAITPTTGNILRWDGSAWVPEMTSPVLTHTSTAITLSLIYANQYIRFTHASGCSALIPTNASIPHTIGTEIHLRATTTGAVDITASGGVTLNVPTGFIAELLGQHATATLKKVGTNEWDLMGLLAS